MDDNCTIDGLDKLIATLQEMGPKLVKNALQNALEASGSIVQVAATNRAPIAEVGTKEHPSGQLKLDVRRTTKVDISLGEGTTAIYVGKHSFYGQFLEFGTSHQKSDPWLRPAFQESQDEAVDVFNKVISAYITDYCNKRKT